MRTKRLTAFGRVQGVGFRPAVRRLARACGVTGTVRNLGGAAELVCAGDEAALRAFEAALRTLPPPVFIERIAAEELAPRRFSDFTVLPSDGEARLPVVPADQGVCPDCLRELRAPGDPRRGYPFISCARCGPRYTIVRALPYDRARTTMDAFAMCPLCSSQYGDADDRRGHGQTISCPHCGPQLLGETRDGARMEGENAVREARALLRDGALLAVKAVGGYNLVCRAGCEAGVRALRTLKRRPTKPFAVLFSDLDALAAVCEAGADERALLTSPARPIVLLERRPGWRAAVCGAVAGEAGTLGAFLPAFGLYALLAEGMPLVVTSCNRTGAPIVFRDAEMRALFAEEPRIAGLFWNEREILRPADDSVARVVCGAPQLLRRTRGYLPEPAVTGGPAGDVLALGAELEPGFCLASGGRFYPAAVPGDLDTPAARTLFCDTIRDLSALLCIHPVIVSCDKHPLYYVSTLAARCGLPVVPVQHHHAHAASVIAEHGLTGPVLGVCFDGTGYGDDGTVWGGEFLLCEGAGYRRAAHLRAVPMLGGDGSMKQGWKSAMCHLLHAGAAHGLTSDPRCAVVRAALGASVNTILNSSMGRLFDAASAMLGLAQENTHQGLCAVACEQAAARALRRGDAPLPMAFGEAAEGGALVFEPAPVVRALAVARDPDTAALGFHYAVADMVCRAAQAVGAEQVALSGGVFANRILLEDCVRRLTTRGFRVYWNQKVPPGDGGISLGQAFLGGIASG